MQQNKKIQQRVFMGGAPGTREYALLAPDKSVAAVDALVAWAEDSEGERSGQ